MQIGALVGAPKKCRGFLGEGPRSAFARDWGAAKSKAVEKVRRWMCNLANMLMKVPARVADFGYKVIPGVAGVVQFGGLLDKSIQFVWFSSWRFLTNCWWLPAN